MSSAQPAETIHHASINSLSTASGSILNPEKHSPRQIRRPASTLAEVAEADKADIDKAVAAARRAFEGKWSKMSARDRGRLLYKLSQLIEQHSAELAALETADNGKPIKESLYVDLPQVVENFEYFAGWATKIEGETIPVPGQDVQLHFARAGRCLRSNHSVEFSVADGGLETRTCTGGRAIQWF